MSRIEQSAEAKVSRDFLTLIEDDQPILVSGMPLRVFHPKDSTKDRFFNDCAPIIEEVLFPPYRLFMQQIPRSYNPHIADCYTTEGDCSEGYPAIQGFLVDGSEVVLGIRSALGFSAKSVKTVE